MRFQVGICPAKFLLDLIQYGQLARVSITDPGYKLPVLVGFKPFQYVGHRHDCLNGVHWSTWPCTGGTLLPVVKGLNPTLLFCL